MFYTFTSFIWFTVNKRYYNIVPSKFINRLRVEEAGKMLELTNKPIIVIAYDVGFNTLSYFIESFKEEFGMTPREFRKNKFKFV